MEFAVTGEIFEWRGPAPYYYVRVPDELVDELREAAREVSYGWGVIPVRCRLGETAFTTSLFPKDGGYLVPLKDKVRFAEDAREGDVVTVELGIGR